MRLLRYGIVGEILLVPTKDCTKSPVPLPAEIAHNLVKNVNPDMALKPKNIIKEYLVLQKKIMLLQLNNKPGFQAENRTEMDLVLFFSRITR